MNCPACGSNNEVGARFCQECGATLALTCAQCGAQVPPNAKFCNQCGAPQGPAAARVAPPPVTAAAVSEQRLVSILFMDLVGFTPLSEGRDPGETRELLSRYFEVARQLVERYNGTVQKFIGDAVVAVWGTPTAREDDAERAVRTGLELVLAVAELGGELGLPQLQARVGVHTGPAAVTLGAEAEGMVVGDMVNTASRIQGAAPAGGVLVAEPTRLASEAAIAYEDAGVHELKGKSEPMQLWQAVRVTATRGGALKSTALEPPFVGREREFRMTKELFHATVDDGRAHHLAVLGIAGIGKSRLAWEFEKYIDGVVLRVLWHHGRCLSYGSGVAYSALAEMIRARAHIVEAEDASATRGKLVEAVATFVADPDERAWVEPRLAHLLGLEERDGWEREELFSGWRLFIEGMAREAPVVLVFEDMQWADAGLLDFIDSLLERSRELPLFVVTMSRPDTESEVGRGRRNATSLYLEPLPRETMGQLLDGLVPGLPSALRTAILERSEGVPLYAVEMVRMLLAQGVLAHDGGSIRIVQADADLRVPDTLHSLIAARLDELSADERRLLQVASVLGKTFRKESLPALIDLPESRIDELLSGLLRKDVLSLQADPRSPERGQYGFIQDLIRHVAYETLPKRDRRALHLAVARHLEDTWGGEELDIVEVLAHHYLEAHRLVPEADDAEGIRDKAHAALIRAAERAASLAAHEEARELFVQAASVAPDAGAGARFLEQAGFMAWHAAAYENAADTYRRSIDMYESAGDVGGAARAAARLGEVEWRLGDLAGALERMTRSFEVLRTQDPDESMGTIAAQLARFYYFEGDPAKGVELVEVALEIAEDLGLPGVLAEALNTKSMLLEGLGHPQEAIALRYHSLTVALQNGLHQAALRAYNNTVNGLVDWDRLEDALELADRGLQLAGRLGQRFWLSQLYGIKAMTLYMLGRWDAAVEVARSTQQNDVSGAASEALLANLLIDLARRPDADAVEMPAMLEEMASREDVQDRGSYLMPAAALRLARGRTREALALAEESMAVVKPLGIVASLVRWSYVLACQAAADLQDEDKLLQLLVELDAYPPGRLTPWTKANIARFRGRLCALTGASGAAAAFRIAENGFREIGTVYWLALTLREHAAWLVTQEKAPEAEPLLAEAAELFQRLGIPTSQVEASAAAPAEAEVPTVP
ncbi:MAG TPA: adenylate/guanylate cyclase domain-containing protein [Candidatus Dormibacteraeota bacterium]